MLTIYLDRKEIPNGMTVVEDMEKAFICNRIRLSGTKEERAVIERVEEGIWRDKNRFEDRFGSLLYLNELSTGSKAVLAILNGREEEVYNLVEYGNNAISVIFNYCKNGSVLLEKTVREDIYDGFEDEGYTDLQIRLGDYVFSSINRLNYYLEWEIDTDEIDMSMEGVKLYAPL